MNKTMYSAPETRIISEDYTSYLNAASDYLMNAVSEDNYVDAKRNNFMEPTVDENSLGTGSSNPWGVRDDDDM
jgi:hypothetical protein